MKIRKKGSRSELQARGQLSWHHHVLAQESKEHRNYDTESGLPCLQFLRVRISPAGSAFSRPTPLRRIAGLIVHNLLAEEGDREVPTTTLGRVGAATRQAPSCSGKARVSLDADGTQLRACALDPRQSGRCWPGHRRRGSQHCC